MTETIFETERLYYRMPTMQDAQAMQNIKEANWPELQKWMNWAHDDQLSMDATKTFIGTIVQDDFNKGGAMMFAFDKQTHDLVMVGGLNATETPHVFSTGYWGNIDYLGQGFATEMTKGVLKYAFEEKNAKSVLISYFDDNTPSRRVIEKCGFDFVETKVKNHQCCLDGVMMDEHCFEIKHKKWEALKP